MQLQGRGYASPPWQWSAKYNYTNQHSADSVSCNSHSGTYMEITHLVSQTAVHTGAISTEESQPEGQTFPGSSREWARSSTTAGGDSKVRAFRKKAQSCCWRLGDRSLHNSMIHSSESGYAGSVSEVVNFLAHLYSKVYQYRSYRSAEHKRINGYKVGQLQWYLEYWKGYLIVDYPSLCAALLGTFLQCWDGLSRGPRTGSSPCRISHSSW